LMMNSGKWHSCWAGPFGALSSFCKQYDKLALWNNGKQIQSVVWPTDQQSPQ
jgi:hypothetical protein